MTMLRLPLPPSTNNLYLNRPGKGRIKSSKYRAWLKDADAYLTTQKYKFSQKLSGPCELHIIVPKIRGDVSNRIKAVEDFLVSREVTGDDKNNVKVSVEIDDGLLAGECWVRITATDEYKPNDDFSRSIDECYRAIRQRKAAGGPGWDNHG